MYKADKCDVQNHSIMVHPVYIKPGGVSDKLCVFPADES